MIAPKPVAPGGTSNNGSDPMIRDMFDECCEVCVDYGVGSRAASLEEPKTSRKTVGQQPRPGPRAALFLGSE